MIDNITLNSSQKKAIATAFGKAARNYDEHALLQKEIGSRLLERLEFFKAEPNTILDLGSGTGYFTEQLNHLYSEATFISLDISETMLATSKQHPNNIHLCADAEFLPLKDECVDLIFSNCTLQWCDNYSLLFGETHRILSEHGLLLFSTFGPDTLNELRESFKMIDNETHVNTFLDMHWLGDALLKANFHAPVVDREIITVTYSNVLDLLKDLKGMGANYIIEKTQHSNESVGVVEEKGGEIKNLSRNFRGLYSPKILHRLFSAYEAFKQEDLLPATFEVIYGYALKNA